MIPRIRPPPIRATQLVIQNILVNLKIIRNEQKICYCHFTRRKTAGGVKYALKIEKPSALGNVFGLTEEDLKELLALIDEALKK